MTSGGCDKFTVSDERLPRPPGPSPNYNKRAQRRIHGVWNLGALARVPHRRARCSAFLRACANLPLAPGEDRRPTSPGGATDAFSRALAPRFSELWGQPVLVENRPGANQILGAENLV